jgi:hypothetical protein
VTSVSAKHNHDLSPGNARYFRCNKNLDSTAKRKLLINDRAGISMSKSYNSLAVEVGGMSILHLVKKIVIILLPSQGIFVLAKEAPELFVTILKGCKQLIIISTLPYILMMIVVRNVFWVYARSRVSYEDFGYVVTFDTTYLTNKYAMPFAPFVGVNHHGQLILLGAILILSEDIKTFVWLFETWLNCMNGRAPSAIITDQDRAMKNAINKVCPNTRHRWCLWHILKKLRENLDYIHSTMPLRVPYEAMCMNLKHAMSLI